IHSGARRKLHGVHGGIRRPNELRALERPEERHHVFAAREVERHLYAARARIAVGAIGAFLVRNLYAITERRLQHNAREELTQRQSYDQSAGNDENPMEHSSSIIAEDDAPPSPEST